MLFLLLRYLLKIVISPQHYFKKKILPWIYHNFLIDRETLVPGPIIFADLFKPRLRLVNYEFSAGICPNTNNIYIQKFLLNSKIITTDLLENL